MNRTTPLRRTGPIKKRARKDPVSSELRFRVILRDGGCIAPLVAGPDEAANCWGHATIEHVKDNARMGVRASSDLRHCVALCQGHTEDGRRAGFQWNTNAANRQLVRAYLEAVS